MLNLARTRSIKPGVRPRSTTIEDSPRLLLRYMTFGTLVNVRLKAPSRESNGRTGIMEEIGQCVSTLINLD